MKLKEITSIIFEEICLYKKSDSGIYEDIWEGKPEYIPNELLDYTIRIIGAKRKGVLDIEIRN